MGEVEEHRLECIFQDKNKMVDVNAKVTPYLQLPELTDDEKNLQLVTVPVFHSLFLLCSIWFGST
jgi:hypothetical protein